MGLLCALLWKSYATNFNSTRTTTLRTTSNKLVDGVFYYTIDFLFATSSAAFASLVTPISPCFDEDR